MTNAWKDGNIYRRSEIDFLKGFGILLVMAGHCAFPDIINYTIYIFHMPLFFMLSGILHRSKKDETYGNFCRRKFFSLLYPYYTLGGLLICYNTLFDTLQGQFSVLKLAKRMAALLYGGYIWENNTEYIGTLWFLACLFITEILFEALRRRFRNQKILGLSCLAITICGILLSYVINASRVLTPSGAGFRLPYCIDIAFVALIFYAMGYLIPKDRMKWEAALLLICGLLLGWLNVRISGAHADMLYLRWGNPVLFLIAAAASCIGLYEIAVLFTRRFPDIKVSRVMYSFGRHSLLIMALHIYINTIICKVLSVAGLQFTVLDYLLLVVLSWLAAYIIDRYLPWIYKYRHVKT